MKKACDAASTVRADRIRRPSKMEARINRGRVNCEETSTWSALVANRAVEKMAPVKMTPIAKRPITGIPLVRTSRGKTQRAGRLATNATGRNNASAGTATQWPMGTLPSARLSPDGKVLTGRHLAMLWNEIKKNPMNFPRAEPKNLVHNRGLIGRSDGKSRGHWRAVARVRAIDAANPFAFFGCHAHGRRGPFERQTDSHSHARP